MLDPYSPPPHRSLSRLSHAWLQSRAWRFRLLPHALLETPYALENLAKTARNISPEPLLGTDVSAWTTRPSAVWHLPPDPARLARFFLAHSLGCHLLFPGDRSFAVHGEESGLATFAGPEPLLRQALPPTPAEMADPDPGHAPILAHYAPFSLQK